jgi:hypothetical protein
MPMRDGCVFCGGKPLTIEHVIPNWLGKILPTLGEGPTAGYATGRVDLKTPDDVQFYVKRGRKTPFEARQPCEKCNTGWMHDLERQVTPWITRMVKGQPVKMPDFAVRSVAAWSVKTTTFIRYADSPPAPTPDCRNKWLFRHKTPPSGSFVFLARYDGGGEPGGDWVRGEMVERSPSASVAENEVHLTTIRLGYLACFVVEVFSGNEASLTIPEKWRPVLVELWPSGEQGAITWPPPRSLTLAGVRQLVRMFEPPPPPRDKKRTKHPKATK